MRLGFAAAVLLSMSSMPATARYPSMLPPESMVHDILEDSPQIMAARQYSAIAVAQQQRLNAGPHEWTLLAKEQRRKDEFGVTYSEQQYGLVRGVRLFGKASLDRELGRQVLATDESAFADAWHEAGRGLLSGIFDWLREQQRARLLTTQIELLREQLRTVQRRVDAGDAPRIEARLAQTELDRGIAAQLQAALSAETIATRLRQVYPRLDLRAPTEIDEPEALVGDADADAWMQRIVGHNHEIELAESLRAEAGLKAERSARDRFPDPTVGVEFSNNLDANQRVIGLTVSLPIGGAVRRADYAAARATANIAEQHAREARLRVESDARRVVMTARSTHEQWQRLRDVAAQTQGNADTMARGYELGEFTIAETLGARRLALEAAVEATIARLNAVEADARLQLDAHRLWAMPDHHHRD